MIVRRWFLFASLPAAAQFPGNIFERLGLGKKPGANRIADGLKEALRIGTGNAIDITGRLDGFFANAAIKILLPEPIRKMERALRIAGFGRKLDELALGMNRAAEAAAPHARDIFGKAILQMTIPDAQKILKGADTAATDYFRDKTSAGLTTLFRPPVERVMADIGVSRQFTQFFDQVSKIPLLKIERLDLEGYVVDRALFGLFYVLGQEETKIRRDPAARVTAILREVFGQR